MTTDRRSFLARLTAAGGTLGAPALLGAPGRDDAQGKPRKKIAFLGTVVRTHSHAQHFLDRLALGYGWKGEWQDARLDVASVFIDQFPGNDLARQRVKKYGLKLYPDVEQALTLGTGKLAVDGVVIIAEHGDYPNNEKGQKRYPRYKWFKECVKVFEKSKRSVPVFNDKHLSTEWKECVEMVEDARRLNFPFFAGSSLPVTRRMPSIEMPHGVPLKESVCVAFGRVDSYDIHALETAQCMSERRKGGEVGIKSVHALRDRELWDHLSKPDREDTRRLICSALTRSHNLPVETGFYSGKLDFKWARKNFAEATGYLIEHLDGFRTTMLLVDIRDFNYAGLRADNKEIVSTQMYLPMPTHGSTTADFFHPLCRHIEDTVITGVIPYPIERTLLASGMVIAGINSLHQGKKIATPEMNIAYQVGKESTYWRD